MSPRRRRGHTLLEVLVAMVVAALVISALYSLFVQGLRLYTRGQARVDIQAAGAVGLLTLSQDLRRASLASLTLKGDPNNPAGPTGVCMRVPDPNNPSGFSLTPSFVLYYFNSSKQVVYTKTWSGAATDPVQLNPNPVVLNERLTAAQFVSICTTTNGTERPIASNVTGVAWNATSATSGNTSLNYPDNSIENVTIGATLSMQKFVNSTDSIYDQVSTTVVMRNP